MAKSAWAKDWLTGLSRKKMKALREDLLRNDGALSPDAFPNCDLFDVRSIAAAAGYADPYYFETRVLTDPSSPFHAHPLTTEAGKTIGYATHTNSARAGGEAFRALTDQRRLKNLRQFKTDPSSGNNVKV